MSSFLSTRKRCPTCALRDQNANNDVAIGKRDQLEGRPARPPGWPRSRAGRGGRCRRPAEPPRCRLAGRQALAVSGTRQTIGKCRKLEFGLPTERDLAEVLGAKNSTGEPV